MWNLWCGGCNVLLVGVVVLTVRRLVWVREGDPCDVGGPIFADVEEFHKPVL